MGIVIQSVANYAPWIYAICGLVALYQLYKIWAVRSERKQAVFSLEREKAIHDTYSILAIALILLATMGFTYFMSTTLAQAVEPLVAEALAPTPALPFLPTPTNTPLPVTPTPVWTATLVSGGIGGPIEGTQDGTPDATTGDALDGPASDDPASEENADEPTPVLEPTATPVLETPTPTPETAPVVVAPACPDQRSLLIRPGQNEVVSGVVNFIGSATHESFQFFKLEGAPGTSISGQPMYLGGGNAPVVSDFLASIDTTTMSNGVWTIQLIVVDQTGNWPPPCQVTVTVQN